MTKEVFELFKKMDIRSAHGYADITFPELLWAFAMRYEAYMHGSGNFRAASAHS